MIALENLIQLFEKDAEREKRLNEKFKQLHIIYAQQIETYQSVVIYLKELKELKDIYHSGMIRTKEEGKPILTGLTVQNKLMAKMFEINKKEVENEKH